MGARIESLKSAFTVRTQAQKTAFEKFGWRVEQNTTTASRQDEIVELSETIEDPTIEINDRISKLDKLIMRNYQWAGIGDNPRMDYMHTIWQLIKQKWRDHYYPEREKLLVMYKLMKLTRDPETKRKLASEIVKQGRDLAQLGARDVITFGLIFLGRMYKEKYVAEPTVIVISNSANTLGLGGIKSEEDEMIRKAREEALANPT